MKKNFVTKFATDKNYYFFNANSAEILKTNKKIYDLFEDFCNLEKQEIVKKYPNEESIAEAYDFIRQYILTNESNKMEKDMEHCFDGFKHANLFKPKSIVINVTDNCNFRCKYCIFGDEYSFTRSINPKNMTHATADKIIGKMKELYNEEQDYIVIGFYGGEPFLAFPIIKKITEAVKNIGIKASFNLTTNGSLLSKEIQDFCVENNFSLLISIDGSKEKHNQNRVDVHNNPTYDTIMSNLSVFKQNYPHYFAEKIRYAATVDSLSNYYEIINYANNNPEYKLNVITGKVVVNNEAYAKIEEENSNFLKNTPSEFFNNNIKEKILKIKFFSLEEYEKDVMKYVLRIHNRKISPMLGGICIRPNEGLKETPLFIATNEDLYICEKMEHTFKIGNLDNWVNIDVLKNMLHKFFGYKKRECVNCVAKRTCSICFAPLARDDDFQFSEAICSSEVNNTLIALKMYMMLLEELGEDELNKLCKGYNYIFYGDE